MGPPEPVDTYYMQSHRSSHGTDALFVRGCKENALRVAPIRYRSRLAVVGPKRGVAHPDRRATVARVAAETCQPEQQLAVCREPFVSLSQHKSQQRECKHHRVVVGGDPGGFGQPALASASRGVPQRRYRRPGHRPALLPRLLAPPEPDPHARQADGYGP